MADFILLMHADGPPSDPAAWDPYFARLGASGAFQGGSQIGVGAAFCKAGDPGPVAGHIGGFIRISANDLADAERWLEGNPVYEAGGTVEIRELPEN